MPHQLISTMLLTLQNKEHNVWFYLWKIWGARSFGRTVAIKRCRCVSEAWKKQILHVTNYQLFFHYRMALLSDLIALCYCVHMLSNMELIDTYTNVLRIQQTEC
jgi:hypothetical protein